PELDCLGDVVGGQGDGLAELVVDHAQGAVGVDASDVPAVAVLDPLGAADAWAAVVLAGDDPVTFGHPGAVGQRQDGADLLLVESGEAVVAGPGVQLGDEV